MNKTIPVIKLIFLTIKPKSFWKDFLFIFIISFIASFFLNSTRILTLVFCSFTTVYAFNSFALSETKDNQESLYATLAIKRKMVILARYLYTLIIDLITIFLANIYTIIILIIAQKPFVFTEIFFASLITFLVITIIQSIQLLRYFKLGNKAMRFNNWLSFMIIFTTEYVIKSINELIDFISNYIGNQNIITSIIILIIWLVVIKVVYHKTLKYYYKKDF